MDYKQFDDFFKEQGGKITEKDSGSGYWSNRKTRTFIIPETITKPVYLEFTNRGNKARIGSIGRLVGFEETSYGNPRLTVEWDDRSKTYAAKYYEIEVLDNDYDDGTKWVWQTNPREKILPFVNKFGQELEKGDLIVGIEKSCKYLRFGYVTRYTKASIWIKPIMFSCDGIVDQDEIWIDNPKQTCMFQEDFLEHLLALKLMQ